MWEKTAWWNLQRLINAGATVNLTRSRDRANFVAQIDEQKITCESQSLQIAFLEAVIEYDNRNGMQQAIYHTKGPDPEQAASCWQRVENLVQQGHWIWINPSRDRKAIHLDVRRALSAPTLEQALSMLDDPTKGETNDV
jgi:hypothetical protein